VRARADKNTGLNKENEQIRLIRKMCAALAYTIFSKVEKVRLVIYDKRGEKTGI